MMINLFFEHSRWLMSNKQVKVDRRIIKSKKALKDSLLSLMELKDFKKITITEIVQLADVNRGTFYKHYQYKEDVLNEIIDDVITDLIASYRDPYKNKNTFDVGKLSSNAVKVFEHVNNHSNFYTLIVNSKVLSGFHYKICDILTTLTLQDLSDDASTSTINRELAASYHSHAIFGMIIEWVNSGFKYSSGYMAEQLLAILNKKPTTTVFNRNLSGVHLKEETE